MSGNNGRGRSAVFNNFLTAASIVTLPDDEAGKERLTTQLTALTARLCDRGQLSTKHADVVSHHRALSQDERSETQWIVAVYADGHSGTNCSCVSGREARNRERAEQGMLAALRQR